MVFGSVGVPAGNGMNLHQEFLFVKKKCKKMKILGFMRVAGQNHR
jgi:hypothetical protein